jgi:hypothetical protein
VMDDADFGMCIPQRPQTLGGRVGAAVIDIDQLERSQRCSRSQDFLGNRRDVVRLVEDRDQDGKTRLCCGCCRGGDRFCSR